MNASEVLSRTALLIGLDVLPTLGHAQIIEGLTAVRVRIAAEEASAGTAAGQITLAASTIAIAQTGARLYIDVPAVPILAEHPALKGEDLPKALLALAGEFVQPASAGADEVDVAFVFGAAAAGVAARVIHCQASDWAADLRSAPFGRIRADLPFGGLLLACAAAAETLRFALALLAERCGAPPSGEHRLKPFREIHLELEPLSAAAIDLGRVDVISAGAITNAALFALLAWPGAAGRLRVIDDDIGAESNLNRYALLRREHLHALKVNALAGQSTKRLQIDPVPERYDERLARELGPLAPRVLVGVDDIPSRWLVARHAPGWVCVGATSHFEAIVSEHVPGGPCPACLHPHDEQDTGEIPTVCFVSQFAGYLQAYRLLASAEGMAPKLPTLVAPFNLSGVRALTAIGMPARVDCPAGCEASTELAHHSEVAGYPGSNQD